MQRPALLLLLLVGACRPDVRLTPKADDPLELFPEITVEPTVLDFGERASFEYVTDHVTIRNEGLTLLTVDELRFDGPGSFELLADDLPWDLDPGTSRTFEVGFQPTESGELQAVVTVISNDADEPEVRVDVLGIGALSDLEITPNPMAFGTNFIPCGKSDTFWFTNHGAEPLQVTRVDLEGVIDGLELRPPSLPFTLYQGQPVAVPVTFDRKTPVTLAAELVVESTDPAGPRRVPITGGARHAQSITETWDVPEQLPVNIVFAVDQSCSMLEQQQALAAEFDTFRAILQNAGTDWKIGVVTGTDSSGRWCFEGGVITPATQNWGEAFRKAVIDAADNSWTEKLLAAVANNLWDNTRGAPPACNAAFTSPPGTPLHIVFLSDERDQSPLPWGDYLYTYRTSVGFVSPVVAHAIVDLYPSSYPDCSGPDAGPSGYYEIAATTGGKILDICSSNWASAVADIAAAAVADLDLYKFKNRNVARGDVTVDVDSVRVWFDGVEVFQPAWTYDAASRGLRFDPPPAPRTRVTISYGIEASCN